MLDDVFYTIDETIKILKISKATIQRKLRKNEIPSIKIGRRVLIPGSFFNTLKLLALQNVPNSNTETS